MRASYEDTLKREFRDRDWLRVKEAPVVTELRVHLKHLSGRCVPGCPFCKETNGWDE